MPDERGNEAKDCLRDRVRRLIDAIAVFETRTGSSMAIINTSYGLLISSAFPFLFRVRKAAGELVRQPEGNASCPSENRLVKGWSTMGLFVLPEGISKAHWKKASLRFLRPRQRASGVRAVGSNWLLVARKES